MFNYLINVSLPLGCKSHEILLILSLNKIFQCLLCANIVLGTSDITVEGQGMTGEQTKIPPMMDLRFSEDHRQ